MNISHSQYNLISYLINLLVNLLFLFFIIYTLVSFHLEVMNSQVENVSTIIFTINLYFIMIYEFYVLFKVQMLYYANRSQVPYVILIVFGLIPELIITFSTNATMGSKNLEIINTNYGIFSLFILLICFFFISLSLNTRFTYEFTALTYRGIMNSLHDENQSYYLTLNHEIYLSSTNPNYDHENPPVIGSQIRIMNCGHIFDYQESKSWFNSHQKCPKCLNLM